MGKKSRYDTDPTYREAVDAGTRGDHKRAIELFEKLLTQGPEKASLRWMVGFENYELGRFGAARANCERAIELDRECIPAWQCLGRTLRKDKEFIMAETAFRQTLELQPSAINYIYLAEVLFQLQRYEEAVNACEAALAIDPFYEEAYLNLGVNLEAKGEYDRAIASLEKAILLDPTYSSAYTALGNVYSTIGKLDLAEQCYATAMSVTNLEQS